MRQMALLCGATSVAVTVVLGLFMGGLALGAWRLAPIADRSRSPSRIYAALELGIAALAPLSVVLLHGLNRSAAAWAGPVAGALCLLLPATLMGATLPVLVRASGADGPTLGAQAGRLYAANTAGGVLGVLASLALIAACGLRGSALAAAGLNVASALLAAGTIPARNPRPAAEPEAEVSETSRLGLVVYAVSGFTMLCGEVLWTRYLVMALGESSTEAFALMLASFLTGLALGGALGGRWARRGADAAARAGAVLLGLAGAVLASAGILSFLIERKLPGLGAAGFLKSLAVLILPTTLAGALFPLAAQLYAGPAPAKRVGRLYAVNAAAAILGAAAGGFLLLPLLGLRAGLAAVASIQAAAGLWLLASSPRRAWPSAAALGLLAAGGAAVFLRARDPALFVRGSDARLVYRRDGAESTVAVAQSRSRGDLTLFVNWNEEAGTAPRQQIHLRLLGHLPALFHPRPERGLVVGLGCGFTTGALARHPLLGIDQVELSRAVLGAQPLFAPFNGAPIADPRVAVHVADGRRFLRLAPPVYDVITSDPINPDNRGASALYSREYYELVRSRLKPGGVACQWLPMNYRPEDYRVLVRTFLSVFPRASLWWADGTTVLLGATAAPAVTRAELRRRMGEPALRASLGAIGVDSPEALLSLLVAGPEQLARFAGSGPLNTDDLPLIEYARGRRDPSRPEAWEGLAELGPAPVSEVVAGWGPADEPALRPGRAALDRMFARRTRPRLVPPPERPVEERARWNESRSRSVLDSTWETLASPPSRLHVMLAGLDRDQEPPPESSEGRRYAAVWSRASAAWRGGRVREARALWGGLAAAHPAALRPALLEAACEDRLGEPLRALDRLLRLDLSVRLDWPELHAFPQRMVDRTLEAMARDPGRSSALGLGLLERLPEGRGRPGAERAGELALWREWWTDARFDVQTAGGKFAWK